MNLPKRALEGTYSRESMGGPCGPGESFRRFFMAEAMDRGQVYPGFLTCTWFPKHGKGEVKKLWLQKNPDEGCKFWETREGVSYDSHKLR